MKMLSNQCKNLTENDMNETAEAPPTLIDETMSHTIAKLADALSQAQGELTGAIKDSSNPFFKSKYADLAAVQDAIRIPFSKHGLAYIQTTEPHETGVVVITLLAHKSGEWIRGKLRMTPTKNDPQGIGSCITYARRYSLAAIAGIAQVDDDAEGATNRNKPEKKVVPNKQAMELLNACESMTELENTWKGLSPDIRKTVGASNLASLKKKLAA